MTAQDLKDRMAAQLRAENNDYYRFDRDYRPAINFAQDIIVTLIDRKLGSNKFSEEALRNLRYTRVWETSKYSRIAFGETVRTLEAVYPKCTYVGTKSSALAGYQLSDSRLLPEITMLDTPYGSATRLNSEEWAEQRDNPFAQGYAKEPNRPVNSYAYKHLRDYGSNADYNPFISRIYTYAFEGGLDDITYDDPHFVTIDIDGTPRSKVVTASPSSTSMFVIIQEILTANGIDDEVTLEDTMTGPELSITTTTHTYGDIKLLGATEYSYDTDFTDNGLDDTIAMVVRYSTDGGATFLSVTLSTGMPESADDLRAILEDFFNGALDLEDTFEAPDPDGPIVITSTSNTVYGTIKFLSDDDPEAILLSLVPSVDQPLLVSFTPALTFEISSTLTAEQRLEIELRPVLSNQVVGIDYVKAPNKVSELTDTVEFPESMLDLLVMAGIIFISNKGQNAQQLYKIATDILVPVIMQNF